MPREGTADVPLSSEGVSTPVSITRRWAPWVRFACIGKIAFFSTREMSKGGDNRARARGTWAATAAAAEAVGGVGLESKREIRLRGVQMASQTSAAKSCVSRVDACK